MREREFVEAFEASSLCAGGVNENYKMLRNENSVEPMRGWS